MAPNASQQRGGIFTFEALVWGGVALFGAALLLETWTTTPVYPRALIGGAAGLLFSLLCTYVALSRGPATQSSTSLVFARIMILVPLVLFWLIVSAAGFAA